MTINRRGLHEEISRLDKEIEQANADKAEYFQSYREQLADTGHGKPAIKLEIDAFKKAERKLRALAKDAEGEIERDDLVDEIVTELQEPVGTKVALARATRTREKTEGRSNAGPAHSAPLAATVRDDRGNPVADTDSDALAINQPPAPSQDSERAAEVAPSVASAAPIPESDEFNHAYPVAKYTKQ